MQNKANLLDVQMNVTSLITADYEITSNYKLRKNKPNTNPLKPNSFMAKMNTTSIPTKDYDSENALPLYFLSVSDRLAHRSFQLECLPP
jgi:hypothetical protein